MMHWTSRGSLPREIKKSLEFFQGLFCNWQDFEHINVASDPANANVVAALSAALKQGPNLVK